MLLRRCSTAIFLFSIAFSAHAKLTCDDLRKALSKDLVDVTCFESPDPFHIVAEGRRMH